MRNSFQYVACLFLAMTILILTPEIARSQSEVGSKTESVSQENSGYVKGITSARARSLVGGVLGLFSIIIGWRGKARKTDSKKAPRFWSVTAMILGLAAIFLSVVHLLVGSGGFGTGGGKAGAIVSLVLGVVGATVSGKALQSRSEMEKPGT